LRKEKIKTSWLIAGTAFMAVLSIVAIANKGIKRRLFRVESSQLDAEIRLDLIEYNHLHEDGNLTAVFEK